MYKQDFALNDTQGLISSGEFLDSMELRLCCHYSTLIWNGNTWYLLGSSPHVG